MCFARSLKKGSEEKLDGSLRQEKKAGEGVLGKGITEKFFHREGKEPVEMERLKMCIRGSEIVKQWI